MPDPGPTARRRVRIRAGEGTDPEKVEAAMEACKQYAPNGGEPPKLNPEQLEQMRKFAQCMRDNGVRTFPDPRRRTAASRSRRRRGDADADQEGQFEAGRGEVPPVPRRTRRSRGDRR